jgi:hypothetical protein
MYHYQPYLTNYKKLYQFLKKSWDERVFYLDKHDYFNKLIYEEI